MKSTRSLIDEARTPLIISGPVNESRQMYDELKEGVSHIVRIQRDLLQSIATEARKCSKSSAIVEGDRKKLAKAQERSRKKPSKSFGLSAKELPRNKILKRLKENPDMRAEIDKWETYFFGERIKKKNLQSLSDFT